MGDSGKGKFGVYDTIIGILQLTFIAEMIFFLRSSPFVVTHIGKAFLATGMSVIFLTRWTAKGGRPWWFLAVIGTVLALSSLATLIR